MICDVDLWECTVSMGVPILIIMLASIGSMIVLQGAVKEWMHWWKKDPKDRGYPE